MEQVLNLLYEKYIDDPSPDNRRALFNETFGFLSSKLKKPPFHEVEASEVLSEALEAILKKVDLQNADSSVKRISVYSGYVFITARNIAFGRKRGNKETLIDEQIFLDKGKAEKAANMVIEKLDFEDHIGRMSIYLEKAIGGIISGVFTKNELMISSFYLRELKELRANEKICLGKTTKASNFIKKSVREQMNITGQSLCNHIKRLKKKIDLINRISSGSIPNTVHFLSKKANEFKFKGFDKSGKTEQKTRKKDFLSAILCYEIINYLEPRYWSKINSPRLKSLVPNFLEAKYNIGFLYQQLEFFDTALSNFKDLASQINEELGVLSQGLIRNEDQLLYGKIVKSKFTQLKKGEEGLTLANYFLSKSYNQIGNVYESKGSYEDAVIYFSRAEECNPKDLHIKFNLIVNYLSLGNTEIGQSIYDQHKSNKIFHQIIAQHGKEYSQVLKRLS